MAFTPQGRHNFVPEQRKLPFLHECVAKSSQSRRPGNNLDQAFTFSNTYDNTEGTKLIQSWFNFLNYFFLLFFIPYWEGLIMKIKI
jgi:hypothetical protein